MLGATKKSVLLMRVMYADLFCWLVNILSLMLTSFERYSSTLEWAYEFAAKFVKSFRNFIILGGFYIIYNNRNYIPRHTFIII